MDKKKNKQVVQHFNSKNETKRLSIYDNEFASDMDFEDRQLELQKEEIRNYTKSNAKTNKKNKTAK